MSYRAILDGGPGDGTTLPLDAAIEADLTEWPEAIGLLDHEGNETIYRLAVTEGVPFDMGRHPNILLTARYSWEAP